MRSHPGSVVLSFLLPAGVDLVLPAVLSFDCQARVIPPLVKISGPSREAVFEVATALLREARRDGRPALISATLTTCGARADTDGWTIILGADVAIAPTPLGAWLPAQDQETHVA